MFRVSVRFIDFVLFGDYIPVELLVLYNIQRYESHSLCLVHSFVCSL